MSFSLRTFKDQIAAKMAVKNVIKKIPSFLDD